MDTWFTPHFADVWPSAALRGRAVTCLSLRRPGWRRNSQLADLANATMRSQDCCNEDEWGGPKIESKRIEDLPSRDQAPLKDFPLKL